LIEESTGGIAAGMRLVEQAGATMDGVVASVGRVTGMVGAISAASAEQRTGIGHVHAAVTGMDAVTQQNAALVEEAAAAAGSLRDQAAALSRMVAGFRLDAREVSVRISGRRSPA
jgi:methyl-accepting chemotaxis protein